MFFDPGRVQVLDNQDQNNPARLGLTLGGGGARAAYQVGVLRAIARNHPQLEIPLLTGVSAGAINIAHLANFEGSLADSIEVLVDLWHQLKLENVFYTDGPSLLWRAAKGWDAIERRRTFVFRAGPWHGRYRTTT